MSWLDNRTQLAALTELIGVVRRGLHAELEPLVWTLGHTGVVGEVTNLSQPSAGAATVFDAWVALLGADVRPAMRANGDGDVVRTARVRLGRQPLDPVLMLRLVLHGFVLDDERRAAG